MGTGGRRLNDDGTTQLDKSTDYLQNNGIYRHGWRKNGEYMDGEQEALDSKDDRRFGIDLDYGHTAGAYPNGGLNNCNGTNNFFSPIHSIDVGIAHTLTPNINEGNSVGGVHPLSYGLGIQIHRYAVNPNEDGTGTPHTFFDARINAFWQPFGETSIFKVSSS